MITRLRAIVAVVCLIASTSAVVASSPGAQPETISKSPSVFEERPIDWRTLIPDIYHDQRMIWTFPGKLVQGKHWEPALGVALVLGGLIALDAHDTPYFRNNASTYSGFNRAFSSTNTALATDLFPVAFYGLGLIRKD